MHKFENSIYKSLWEDKNALTTILNTPDLIKANHTFWRQDFDVDPSVTPTNEFGEAVFTSRMRKLTSGELMDMRAPLFLKMYSEWRLIRAPFRSLSQRDMLKPLKCVSTRGRLLHRLETRVS